MSERKTNKTETHNHSASDCASTAIADADPPLEQVQRSKIIEALTDIANEIAMTRDVFPVLENITHRAVDLLGTDHVAIYLLQEDGFTLKTVAANGAYQKELVGHTLKVGDGITGSVFRSGKAEIINDIQHDPRRVHVPGTPEKEEQTESLMSAPLILHGKTIGVINAWRLRENGLFNDAELNFLIGIAHQASICVESGRLFQETRRQAQEAAAIAEVGRGISSTLELDVVLERIASYAMELLDAETSAVYLAKESTLHAIAAFGIDAEAIKNDPLLIGNGILGNIALQNIGEIVNDTAKDPRISIVNGTEKHTFGHLMGVPILLKDKHTGLLAVWRLGKGTDFKQNELEFLTSLAQQAAVAIENARLYSELQQELNERKKAEQALRNSEKIHRQAIEVAGAVPYYQLFFGRENKYEFIGEGIRQLTGYGPEEFTESIWNELIEETVLVGELSGLSVEEGATLVRSGKRSIWQCEHRIRARDGKTHWVRDAAVDYYDENGISYGSVGMYMDITERKQAEEKVRELNASLEKRVEERTEQLQAEKMKIEKIAGEVAMLRRLSDFLQASLTVDEASKIIINHLRALFPNTAGALFLSKGGVTDLSSAGTWGNFVGDQSILPNSCWGMRRGRMYARICDETSPACMHLGDEPPVESMCVPLLAQGESVGMICLQNNSVGVERYFTPDRQDLALAGADSIALALANLRLREHLQIQSIRDALTGLFNRRYLDETLPREIQRAERRKQPISVIMFDIDYFKKFNDTRGHDAGDVVLKGLANLVLTTIRAGDIACRYGGEEFTVILPDTPLDVARERAEQIRLNMSKTKLKHNGQDLGTVTLSLGVATYPQHGLTRDELIKNADTASYRAKEGGRNQVVVYQ